ncbi:MAG: hypothetical protein EAZ37_12105 [Burkholderiales bacterium]|nr:MAG: hypothetical protein EAZ37_12105 [Burkholderiales bacterium]
MTVRVIGVRHHSPACARLIQRLIARDKPAAVLIEGPGDFNPRMEELLLAHRLPVALYSYANEGQSPAQCWFPFLDYSPEWVALHSAHEAGALLRFIDLPHWEYRAISDAHKLAHGEQPRSRYALVVERMCERFGCDGDHALWDHLFEGELDDADLHKRLDLYFDELRAEDPSTPQDQARELQMARWVAWAQQQVAGDVLVICGGWHKRAIEQLWPQQNVENEPVTPAPTDAREAGCYLVPYEYRQVDALGGYRSGMQSPMFYQWVWEMGLQAAGERAVKGIAKRLRGKKVAFSTAEHIAMRSAQQHLAQLRGHALPLRGDLLDALQSTVIKEALDAPAPWTNHGILSDQHHPVLREALLTLTGEGGGTLHADTPLPPLVHDVTARLAQCNLTPLIQRAGMGKQAIVLDRRRAEDLPRAHTLWQLKLIGLEGAQLIETRAPHAARQLPAALNFEEHWSLVQGERWFPNLIEAAAFGATLESAARSRLEMLVAQSQADVGEAAACLLKAVRAGLLDMGDALGQQLEAAIPAAHDLAQLAKAAGLLLQVVQAGFWGQDTRVLLERALSVLAERILWLLEERQGSQDKNMEADVAAVSVFDSLLRLQLESAAGLSRSATLATLLRLARKVQTPPALRGAALGVAYVHDALGEQAKEQILALVRAVPPRDALGDFLYGLFCCARVLATESDSIVNAVHEALEGMGSDDFLVALPQLRAAFAWFPPRERGALAARVAALLGLSASEQSSLLSLRTGTQPLLDAKRIEAQALAWATALEMPV